MSGSVPEKSTGCKDPAFPSCQCPVRILRTTTAETTAKFSPCSYCGISNTGYASENPISPAKEIEKGSFQLRQSAKDTWKKILIDDKVDDDIILSGLRDGMGDIRIDQNNIPLFQKDIFVVDRLPALPAVDKIQFDVLMDMFRDMDEARVFIDEILLI